MPFEPSKSAILAAKSLREAKTLLIANVDSLASDTSWQCTGCKNCQQCKLCKDCERCVSCYDCVGCFDCSESSSLENCHGCKKCFGSDVARVKMLRDCSDCVYVERSILVVGERGTPSEPIANRFGKLQLTAAEFDVIWALPTEAIVSQPTKPI
jgi:hypothetical protein